MATSAKTAPRGSSQSQKTSPKPNMADQIDIQCQIQLPNSNSNAFVQLSESAPERVFYRINLRDPADNVTHVVPPHVYDLPVLHDLGLSANALRGYRMICVGTVGLVVKGSWNLECQTFVDGNLVKTCGPGTIDGEQGGMYMFRFSCTFV
jgi:hypothetical protein